MARVLVVKYSSCQVNPIFQKTEKPSLSIQVRNYGKEINYEMKIYYKEATYPNNWDNYCLYEIDLDMRVNLDRAEITIKEIKKMIKKLINDIENGLSNIELIMTIDDIYYKVFSPPCEPSVEINMKTIGGDFPRKDLVIVYYG